jgi:hypothetical protein
MDAHTGGMDRIERLEAIQNLVAKLFKRRFGRDRGCRESIGKQAHGQKTGYRSSHHFSLQL